MSNIFENKGAFAVTIVVAASDSLNRAAANYVCDGAADEVEINAALAALPAAGGRVVLLEGHYVTVANIVVPANATVEGQGKGTIITPTGAAITRGFDLNGDNITLKDMKIILAAGAGTAGSRPNVVYANAKTRLWLENLWLVGDQTVGDDGSLARQNSIYFWACTNCGIVNCNVEGNQREGIVLHTGQNNVVNGNTCSGNTRSGIRNDGANYTSITGNVCSGSLITDGICLTGASTGTAITGNTCNGNAARGIWAAGCSNCTLTGNTCNGNGLQGILLSGAGCKYNTVAGNICNGNTENGIIIELATYNTFTGNTCNGNTRHGIWVMAGPNTLTGNTCSYNDHAGNTYSGIYIGASSHWCVIAGNLCDHNGLHGIYIFRSDYCTISGNGCHYQTTGDGINVTGDGTRNADYNTITGNACTSNADDGIAIEGAGDANKNIVVANSLLGNTGTNLVDNGTLTEVGHNITA